MTSSEQSGEDCVILRAVTALSTCTCFQRRVIIKLLLTAPKLHPLSTILTKTKHQPANANDRVPKQTLPSALVVLSSLADPGFLSTLLVSFYLLLFSFTITDTDTYSTGEPYRGVVCEDTRGLTLVRVPRGSHPWNP